MKKRESQTAGGSGNRKNYQPWLLVSKASSRGSRTMRFSRIPGGVVHLLSRLEFVSLCSEFHERFVDIKENEVELDVVVGRGETEATGGEIGAAHDGGGHFAAPNVSHLAVQETGSGDRANLDLVSNPGGTGLGDVALV